MTTKKRIRYVHNEHLAWTIPYDAPTPEGALPGSGPFTPKGKKARWYYWITDGTTTKRIAGKTPVPTGWIITDPPMSVAEHVRINNGVHETSIPKDKPIPVGWVRGRLPYKEGTQYWFTDGFMNVRAPLANNLDPSFKRGRTMRQTGTYLKTKQALHLKPVVVDGFSMLVPIDTPQKQSDTKTTDQPDSKPIKKSIMDRILSPLRSFFKS